MSQDDTRALLAELADVVALLCIDLKRYASRDDALEVAARARTAPSERNTGPAGSSPADAFTGDPRAFCQTTDEAPVSGRPEQRASSNAQGAEVGASVSAPDADVEEDLRTLEHTLNARHYGKHTKPKEALMRLAQRLANERWFTRALDKRAAALAARLAEAERERDAARDRLAQFEALARRAKAWQEGHEARDLRRIEYSPDIMRDLAALAPEAGR